MTEPNKMPIPIPNKINPDDERIIKINGFELDLTGWGDVLLTAYENCPSDQKNEKTDLFIKSIAKMFPGKQKYKWIDPLNNT